MKLKGVPVLSIPAASTAQAVRFSAANQRYSRSASGLGTNFTWTCWMKVAVDRNAYSIAIAQGSTNYYRIGTGIGGTIFGRDTTSGGSISSSYDMGVGNWVFIASVNDTAGGGQDYIYWHPAGGSASNIGGGGTVTGPADANTLYIGGDQFNDFLNGSVAAVKIWTTTLTLAEIAAERDTYAAVKTASLWANYKFNAGPSLVDDSGLGKTLTAGAGTPVVDTSGPPIT